MIAGQRDTSSTGLEPGRMGQTRWGPNHPPPSTVRIYPG